MTYGSQTILILDPSIYNMYAEIQRGVDATRATLMIPKLCRKWQIMPGFQGEIPANSRKGIPYVGGK